MISPRLQILNYLYEFSRYIPKRIYPFYLAILIYRDLEAYIDKRDNRKFLYSPKNDLQIDEHTYLTMAQWIRKINILKRVSKQPGNDKAKEYLIEKNRRKQKRLARKKWESELEKLVVALVNQGDFKYNYEEIMDLSIYKFYQSFKQIQTNINFENTMRGVYAELWTPKS